MRKAPKIIMRGAMGFRLDALQPDHIDWLKQRLTLRSIPFKDQEPLVVQSAHEEDGYLWVPRYFDHLEFWPKIKAWRWIAPHLDYELHQLMRPLPERKQPEAIDAIEEALRRDGGCIGILPTGTGKTMIALSVARRFQTPIAIFVYKGDMIDNWVEHAESVLGIPPEDVGIVKENRCDLGKPLTIVSIQTVLARNLPQEFYDQIGFIVGDECLTGDAMITTEIGQVPIKDIPSSGAKFVLCFDDHVDQWVYRRIRRWIPQGIKKTLTIETIEGQTIRCTQDHLLRTTRGWIEASKLLSGDRILSPASVDVDYGYLHETSEEDQGDLSPGTTLDSKSGLIGKSGLGPSTRVHHSVGVGVESNSRYDATSHESGSEITDGPTLFSGTHRLKPGERHYRRSRRALSLEHCSAIHTSSRMPAQRQTQELHSIMAYRSSPGQTTRLEDWKDYRSRLKSLRTQDMGTSSIEGQASAIHRLLRSLNWSVDQRQFPQSGSPVFQMKAGPGGTWMTDPANVVVSAFTQRVSQKKRSRESRNSFLVNSQLIRRLEDPKENTGILDCESRAPLSGLDLFDHSQHRAWNTNFLTITKIEEDQGPGEHVFDLEVEEHHNFVANGFLVHNCHRYGASKWSKVVAKFPARYRLGMSADPVRDDGLDPIIRWNFGKVGYAIHTRPTGELPLVCLIRYPAIYPKTKFCDWKKVRGKWRQGSANATKYSKLLMKDETRNEWLVGKIIEARLKGRRILVFAHLRAHIQKLHDRFVMRWNSALTALDDAAKANLATSTSLLVGGLKDKDRKKAALADVIFTTFQFCREATNLPHIDTLVFATPPGNPLQPAGRLRDKGPSDRKPPLIIDPHEENDYSFGKALKRKGEYENLGMIVKRLRKK